MEDLSSCVYFHVNPIKQEVFYVGIGNNKRPYKQDRSTWWKRTIDKYSYEVIVIHENLSWEEACKLEIKYIAQIGRQDKGLGSLVNLTDGGEGSKGRKCSEETKSQMSSAHKGKILSEEHKLKIKIQRQLNPFSKEALLKMSLGSKGKPKSEETKKKMKQVKRSDDFKRKVSLTHKGKIVSPETKLKLSLSRKGKIMSEETKLKIKMTLLNKIKDTL